MDYGPQHRLPVHAPPSRELPSDLSWRYWRAGPLTLSSSGESDCFHQDSWVRLPSTGRDANANSGMDAVSGLMGSAGRDTGSLQISDQPVRPPAREPQHQQLLPSGQPGGLSFSICEMGDGRPGS